MIPYKNMSIVFFVVTFLLELLLVGSLAYSSLRPQNRIWPLRYGKSWTFLWIWSLTLLSFMGTAVVAILDWNTFVFSHWYRFLIGAGLFFSGTAFAVWGVATLSLRTSSGIRGDLVTTGAYRFSRNPQYVGDFGVLLGIAIVANSLLAWILCLLGIICFAVAPLAEEPWLGEQYGERYENYRRQVPRFLGWRKH